MSAHDQRQWRHRPADQHRASDTAYARRSAELHRRDDALGTDRRPEPGQLDGHEPRPAATRNTVSYAADSWIRPGVWGRGRGVRANRMPEIARNWRRRRDSAVRARLDD